MFTTSSKNTMLDALTLTQASAHTAFPGGTGSNEVVGGAYVRIAPTFAAASGGTRALSAALNFAIPAGVTVRWLGLWNGAAFVGYAANDGVPKEFICTPATDLITCPIHGYVDTNKVVLYGDTVPAGLTEGTIYYVRDATADTFKLAATAGGAVIDLTSAGGSACVVSNIVEELYGGAGTHTITGWTLGLPN